MTTDNYKKYTIKNPFQRFLINRFFNTLKNEFKNLKPYSILDVGCGEGFILEHLRQEGVSTRLEGVEYNKHSIFLGKQLHPHITIREGDIYQLPYENNSFDVVLCSEVLEHLEYPEKALVELNRVARKYAIITVPNEPYFRIANFLRGKNLFRFGNDIEHIQHWSKRDIKNLVKQYFEVKNIKTSFPWTIVIGNK